jgi:lipopolysaccharide transport system permease protein
MNTPITTVIEPSGKWLRIPWREIVQYRDLLFLMVRRDFVSRYKQTILGPIWFILQPLLYTIIFTVVFKKMAGFSTGNVPGPVFYFSGMLAWQYFSQCLKGTSATFLRNANLFGKVYFPRLIVPISVVLSNLLAYLIVFLTFLGFFVYYRFFSQHGETIRPNWSIAFLPLIVLQTAALGLGVGLWMSAMTAKYRDFTYLSDFMTQLWMFATLPLFMVVEKIPPRLQWVVDVNPVCFIVQWYRYAFLGIGAIDPLQAMISIAATLLILLTGILIFCRTERYFIDTV